MKWALIFILLLPAAAALDNYSLTAYWSFDNDTYGGGDWTDKVLAHNVSDINSVHRASDCLLGECFNGSWSKYGHANEADLDISTTQDFGISVWVKFYDISVNQTVIGNQPYTTYIRMYDTYDAAPVAGRITGYYAYGSGNVVRLNHYGLSADTWYHIVVNQESANQTLYVDGVLVNSSTNTYTGSLTWELEVGRKCNANGEYLEGLVDEVAVVNGKVFTAENITDLYNSGTPLAWPFTPPGPGAPTAVNNLPYDEDHTKGNGDGTLNFSANITTDAASANCTLFINSSGQSPFNVSWLGGQTNGTINFNSVTLNETRYEWHVRCDDENGQVNSTATHVIFDTTSPDWVYNNGNFFAQDNTTLINPFFDGATGLLNVSLQDNFVFSYNISIRNSTQHLVWSKQQTAINSTNENISETINWTTWNTGNFEIVLYGEDDHTIQDLAPIPYSLGARSITYDTPTAAITITSTRLDGGEFTTEKLQDRYTFAYNPINTTSTWTFRLESTKPLHYRGDLYPFASFVTGKQWVDFNTGNPLTIYEVHKEDDYTYEIEIETEDESAEILFNSLGGLNSKNESFNFSINHLGRQHQNLTENSTGVDWIKVTWDEFPETNWTEIFRDGTNIANVTNATGEYNDTNLTYATYNYTIYSVTSYSEKNTTVTGENSILVTPLLNTSINLQIYNEESNTLITGVTCTVNLVSDTNNVTLTTTTGKVDVSGEPSENYTIKHTCTDYGDREQYLEVINNSATNANLYLLNASGYLLPFTVEDYQGRLIENATIHLQRWFENVSAYVTVEMTQTSQQGDTNAWVTLGDAWYKPVLYYGSYTNTNILARRYSSSDVTNGVPLRIDIREDPFESWVPVGRFVGHNNITYDASQRNFQYIYNYGTVVQEVCLQVWKVDRRLETLMNETCNNAGSATIVTGHAAVNKSIYAKVVVETNTENSVWVPAQRWLNVVDTGFSRFGAFGLFVAGIVISIFGLVSNLHPAVPIVGAILGLIGTWITFGLAISTGTIVGIVGVGIGLIMLFAWRAGR